MAASKAAMKLVLCGNGSVGKTSIIQRFVADGFDKRYKQTVGLDFFEKTVKFRGDAGTTLQVWDIGGQSIGSGMLDKYLGGSDLVFLCYDVTDERSFADAEDWLAKVSAAGARHRESGRAAIQVYLVGNKADLAHLRQVKQESHDAFIRDHGLDGGFLVSARSGDRVTRSFYDAAARAAGEEMSAHDLAFHDAVVGYSVDRPGAGGGAERPDPAADGALARQREEDAEAERRMQEQMQRELEKDAAGGCCAVC